MADIVDKSTRSRLMSGIRSKNTQPELVVRSALHMTGCRFRLHRSDLPGRPDLVLPKYRVTVFVHGCFWHRHPGCRLTYMPKSRIAFWRRKFQENIQRDRKVMSALSKLGWRTIVIWECETRDALHINRKMLRIAKELRSLA